MGAVYSARDERLGRDVAIKLLRADLAADAAARQRFLREGEIAAQIVHPNVVRTYDAGDDPAGTYLVQEFLLGETLDQLIPVPPRQAAALLGPIAAALGHIHDRGYVHCDVKPQNIMLRDNGTPMLLDFGIARLEGSQTSALIATPHYLAPERAQGAPPTAAADLYAFGIVLFQAVAGRPPFGGSAVPAIIRQHIEQPVPRLGVEDPAAPVLDRIIARLTAKRPEDRYSSTVDLQNDLRTVAQDAVHSQPTVPVAAQATTPREASALPPPRPAAPPQTLRRAWAAAPAWRRRRRLAAALAPLALLLLGLGFVRARGRDGEASGASTSATVPSLSETTSATAAPPPETTPATAPASSPTTPAAAPAPSPTTPAAAPAPLATAAPVSQSIAVPEVVGLPYDEAAVLLSQQGLVAQRGDEQPAAEPPGTISGTDPPASTVLQPGTTVLLHVSTGPASEPLPVPPPPATDDTIGGDNDDKPADDGAAGADNRGGGNQDDKPDKDNGKGNDDKPDKDNGKGNDDKND